MVQFVSIEQIHRHAVVNTSCRLVLLRRFLRVPKRSSLVRASVFILFKGLDDFQEKFLTYPYGPELNTNDKHLRDVTKNADNAHHRIMKLFSCKETIIASTVSMRKCAGRGNASSSSSQNPSTRRPSTTYMSNNRNFKMY